MSAKRVWTQEVKVEDGVGKLILTHVETAEVVTYLFSPRLRKAVSELRWGRHTNGYAQSNIAGTATFLHWLAVGKVAGQGHQQVINHKNCDRTDNRDENLETASKRQDAQRRRYNSPAGYGLQCDKRGYYKVRVRFGGGHDGTRIFCPGFKDATKAKACRDAFNKLADEYDAGLRPLPTKAELVMLADSFR